MKYTVDMGPGATIYIPSVMDIKFRHSNDNVGETQTT
jgi:hypothetical protein